MIGIDLGVVPATFIPRAGTWLNLQRWSDHAAVAALAELAGPEIQIEQAVQMFAKFGKWSRHAGPEPGMLGCRASPELLGKYGLGPDGRKLDGSHPAALKKIDPGCEALHI